MKVTAKQITDLLSAAGVQDVEIVEDEATSEFNLDAALTAIDTAREGIIRPKIEGTLRETIEKEISGLNGGKLETWLNKHTGISRAAMKDKPDEDKIKLAINHLNAQLDGDKQGIQAKIDEILEKHNQDVEALKSEYETKLKGANDKYNDRAIEDFIEAELKDFPFKSDVDKKLAIRDLKTDLKQRYDLTPDEANRSVKLFTKDKPGIEALNPAGTTKITVKDEANAYFTPRGQVAKDTRESNPADATNKQAQNTYVPPVGQQHQQADPVAAMNAAIVNLGAAQGLVTK